MTGTPVRVVFTKYDGSLHWHQTMWRLGEDRHGIWLGAPRGTTARKGHDGPEVLIDHVITMLFPRESWWTAVFNGPPASLEIYCDITGPHRWIGDGEVTMVDLDLDVARVRADGRVALLDEDEFAEHQHRYAYPPDVVEAASAAARWLHQEISAGHEPFASEFRTWLARAETLG